MAASYASRSCTLAIVVAFVLMQVAESVEHVQENGCDDDPAFRDAQGFSCHDWAERKAALGGDSPCSSKPGYSQADLEAVRSACSATCRSASGGCIDGPLGALAAVMFVIMLVGLFPCFLLTMKMCCESDETPFEGRVFLPPSAASENTECTWGVVVRRAGQAEPDWAPSDELHVNIGWITRGGKTTYPDWMPLFQAAISEQDYNLLIGRIKEYREKNTISRLQETCGRTCCLFPWGMVSRWFFLKKKETMTRELDNISKDFGARVEFYSDTKRTGDGRKYHAFDQFGKICKYFYSHGPNGGGAWKPCWPPTGYNIILRAPGSFDLRGVWPGAKESSPGADHVQQPQTNQMMMPSIPPPPYTPAPDGSVSLYHVQPLPNQMMMPPVPQLAQYGAG